MSKPNNGWGGREREREGRGDCLARNIQSLVCPPTQVTSSRTRGNYFCLPLPSRVRLQAGLFSGPSVRPFHSTTTLQFSPSMSGDATVGYYFSAFLSTFIIPLPVDTMGLQKHYVSQRKPNYVLARTHLSQVSMYSAQLVG